MGLGKKLVLIALAAALAWWLYSGGAAQLTAIAKIAAPTPTPYSPPASVERFEEDYGDKMLSYNDPYYGFALRYPIGYAVAFAPELGVQIRVTAMTASNAESIEVRIGNETAREAYDENADSPGIESTGTRIGANGKPYYYINGLLNEFTLEGERYSFEELLGEKLLFREAFFDCATPEGESYAAAVIAIIPESLSRDAELADYVINTFECS